MTTETRIVICVPTDVPGGIYIAGIGRAPCESCGVEIAVSPSTWQIIEESPGDNWVFLCAGCALDALKADPNPTIMPITPAQISEIEEALGGRP